MLDKFSFKCFLSVLFITLMGGCLEQEVEKFTVAQTNRLLAGSFGSKKWRINNQPYTFTFNTLVSPNEVLVQDTTDVAIQTNFQYTLSTSNTGVFTDTLTLQLLSGNDELQLANNPLILKRLTSLSALLETKDGVQLELVVR